MADTSTLDAPPAESAGPDAGLDQAIAELGATISAAQTQPQTPTTVAGTPSTDTTSATSEQPADETAQEPGGQPSTDDERPETPEEEAKPTSRMGRLRAQLTTAEETARAARAEKAQLEGVLNEGLQRFVNLVLPEEQFETLRQKAESGDWEAKQQLDVARTWRQMVAPVWDVAQRKARMDTSDAVAAMRTLDGMDADTHTKLSAATTPADQIKMAWQFGRKSADSEHKERIASLEAEVQALKTNKAANGSQPANGGSPQQIGGSGLAGLIGPDGLLTDEAERLSPAQIRARFGSAA